MFRGDEIHYSKCLCVDAVIVTCVDAVIVTDSRSRAIDFEKIFCIIDQSPHPLTILER